MDFVPTTMSILNNWTNVLTSKTISSLLFCDGFRGYEFSDLMKYVLSHQKTIIFAESFELSYWIHVYLPRYLLHDSERLQRLHLYNALCWAKDDVETLCTFDENDSCQIIISTIALVQGISCKSNYIIIKYLIQIFMNNIKCKGENYK